MVEEWDLFRRIEGLEEKLKEIEGPVPMDALGHMITVTFVMSFYAFCLHDPENARKIKDALLGGMRKRGLNPLTVKAIEKMLNSLVEDFKYLAKK